MTPSRASSTTDLRTRPGAATVAAVVGAVLLLVATTYGGWTALAAPARSDTLRTGGAEVRVVQAEVVPGLTAEDLSGMGHGIAGLVRDDSTMLRVHVVVTAGDHAAVFDPAALRLVRRGHDAVAVGSSVVRTPLHAHASLDATVGFVVPRDGQQLVLGAAGTGDEVLVSRVDVAPAADPHHHGQTGRTHQE